MATVVSPPATVNWPDRLSDLPNQSFVDRWLYVGMAAWFIVIVLVGFIPDSIDKAAAIQAGLRQPFPIVMHVHAVLMGAFLLLLLAQTWLAATGHIGQHRRLGIAVAVLVPALVVVGFLLAPVAYFEVRDAIATASADHRGALQAIVARKENVLLNQMRIGVLFPLFMAIALSARRTDPGLHKRMIFLGSAVALTPAFARMLWLPALPIGAVMSDLMMLIAVAPMFVTDIARNRRVHAAYWIWLAISVPFAAAVYVAWNQPWWHQTARAIFDSARSLGLA